MPHDSQAVLPSSPAYAGSARLQVPDVEAVEVGESVIDHLLAAGLDLNVVLAGAGDALASNAAAGPLLRRAIDELDHAVRELRHLMLADGTAAMGTNPDGVLPRFRAVSAVPAGPRSHLEAARPARAVTSA